MAASVVRFSVLQLPAAVLTVLAASVSSNRCAAAVCDLCPSCRFFYVRECGNPFECNDENDGRSPQRAWATLTRASDYLNGRLPQNPGRRGSPGDVIIVGPGYYPEGNIDMITSGNAMFPIMFLGDPTGTCTGDEPGPVLIDARGGCVDTRGCDTGFLVFGASHVVVAGFQITGARVAGVQVRPGPFGERSAGAVVANNEIFDVGEANTGRGVQVFDSRRTLVFNNLIYGHTTEGVTILGTPDARVINNTVVGGLDGILVATNPPPGSGLPSPGAWVLNNIITGSGRFGIDVDRFSRCNYIGAFNLLYGTADRYSPTAPRDRSDITARDPGFVDPQRGDFRLRSTSPALNRGSASAELFGLSRASARVDGEPDVGRVDIGFHHDNVGYPTFAGVPVDEEVLYVRAGGSDAADGLAPHKALRTVSAALSLARAVTRIVVGPGVYADSIGPSRLHPAGPLTFFADPRGELTGDPPGPVLIDARRAADGFNITGRCSDVIDGFWITNAGENGIFLKEAHNAVVRNNVTFSNGRLGISVSSSDDVKVINNLVYDNGQRARGLVQTGETVELPAGGGIQIGGPAGFGSRRTVIENNTVYRNAVNGILIGTGGEPSPGARVRFNILMNNGSNGLQVNNAANAGASVSGMCVEYNINADPYGPIHPRHCAACLDMSQPRGPCTTPPCSGTAAGCVLLPSGDRRGIDPFLDPLFVRPAGVDGCLGRRRFWDDDFRLQDDPRNPAIDFGPEEETAETLGLGGRTTRVDGAPDEGKIDSGFHYLPMDYRPPSPVGDCDGDGRVTVEELVRGLRMCLLETGVDGCPAFDLDGNDMVTIDEVLRAVGDLSCSGG